MSEKNSITKQEVDTDTVGKVTCHIQGNVSSAGFVVLTVHDLGCNHTMWLDFVKHSSMEEITKRAAWVHVDIPGQEDDAQPLPTDYHFPSMQQIADALPKVLDGLSIKGPVVCIGEGAGANIIARFAIAHSKLCLGSVLIHCTGTTAGFMESLKDRMIGWKLDHIGMNPTAEAYLVLHRFGSFPSLHQTRKTPQLEKQKSLDLDTATNKEQLTQVIDSFKSKLRSHINPHNLKLFVDTFMKRSNITSSIKNVNNPVLMITGSLASHNHTVHTLFRAMAAEIKNKKCVEFVEVDGVANVVEENPTKLAECFLYFIQGVGLGGGVPMHHVSAGVRVRTVSMEEADMPKSVRSGSLTETSPPKLAVCPQKEEQTENADGIGAGDNN